MYKLLVLFVGLSAGLAGCTSSQCWNCPAGTATITGLNYDTKKDQTVLTLLPYGGITFPHKWEQVGYDEGAKARILYSDSTRLHASLIPFQEYKEIYQKGRTDQEHLAAFTTWETEFWRNEQHVTVDILQDSSATKGYILGRAYDATDKSVDAIFLFGTRRGLLYNFRGTSSKWTQEELEVFLKGLFVRN
jgi:hypothetical protein